MNKTDDKKNHHAKPHRNVEVQIAYCFVKNKKPRHIHKEPSDNSIG